MTNNQNCQLTGHPDFDKLFASLASATSEAEQQALEDEIWARFGSTGAVMISDMAGFSSTSRRNGICHYLKLIARARSLIAPVIARNNGVLLKCDADNCYAFFENVDDAIRTSFEACGPLARMERSVPLKPRARPTVPSACTTISPNLTVILLMPKPARCTTTRPRAESGSGGIWSVPRIAPIHEGSGLLSTTRRSVPIIRSEVTTPPSISRVS